KAAIRTRNTRCNPGAQDRGNLILVAIAVRLNLPIIPAVLFCIATSLVVLANMIFYAILGEVNGKRAPQEQIGILFVNVT
ncbi:MAG TPA: hypothetical protein VK818_14845, partial [Methylomirabilota bacterium]|nr:hypothetical protein [Methylomirabilota bacterium]